MNIIEIGQFDRVEMIRLGFSPISSPLMPVWMYVLDGIVIDTGQHHMANAVDTLLCDKTINLIALTHHHEDHSGNAAMLSAKYAIPANGLPWEMSALPIWCVLRWRP